jgi:two-component system OmpR family sensor kinase
MTLRPLAAGRRLLARTPLQVKLIAAVLVLVTVALALIGLASVAALDGYLVGRLDDQLALVADRYRREDDGFRPGPGGGGRGPGPPSPYLVQKRNANGGITGNLPNDSLDNEESSPRLPSDAAWFSEHAGKAATVPATSGDGRWRVVVEPIGDGDNVVVAASLDGIDSTTRQLRTIDLVVSLVVLVLLAGVGAAIVRASLRPLVEIEQTARAIAAGDLTRRVPERDPGTEVGRLGQALNTMLAQIESAFGARAASEASARRSEDRMRRFVADASHELRTPLTTIRGFAELYRQGAARDPAELDRLMRRIEDQAARMGLLVEDLLLLARLDTERPLDHQPVDLLALAAEAVNDARAVAPDRRIELVLGGDDGDHDSVLVVLGDDRRLRQVLANLVNNALTHTPAGSPIEVRVGTSTLDGRPGVAVEVVDHGPGLAPEQAERVFERFYRADPARSPADGGSGLGLSIVAALVAVHGGTVAVDSVPGRGPASAWSSPWPPTPPADLTATSQPQPTLPQGAGPSIGACKRYRRSCRRPGRTARWSRSSCRSTTSSRSWRPASSASTSTW